MTIKKILSLATLFFLSSAQTLGAPRERRTTVNIATPENLAVFEFVTPELSDVEEDDVRAARFAEQLDAREVPPETPFKPQRPFSFSGRSSNVTIEIFQNARTVGRQFLVAREKGQIRYVFAVSAAGSGHSTPDGDFGVYARPGVAPSGQAWRRMSATYPSKGENNMDHVTYFRPVIGFHSTVFGLYAKLGRADSHGCVRMARPEARAVYKLIKNNGSAATIISHKYGDPNPTDLPVIKELLAKDLNFIQNLLVTRNRADVPFGEKEYFAFASGQMDPRYLREVLRRNNMKQITEINPDMDRFHKSTRKKRFGIF